MKVVGVEKGGFVNDPIRLTLVWNDLVHNAKDIMFFGAPLETTRSFDPFFWRKFNPSSLFSVFKYVVMEYWGDSNSSSQLYAAYCKRKEQ